jgi:hypothetical protein
MFGRVVGAPKVVAEPRQPVLIDFVDNDDRVLSEDSLDRVGRPPRVLDALTKLAFSLPQPPLRVTLLRLPVPSQQNR